jgi:hypothetical protein
MVERDIPWVYLFFLFRCQVGTSDDITDAFFVCFKIRFLLLCNHSTIFVGLNTDSVVKYTTEKNKAKFIYM